MKIDFQNSEFPANATTAALVAAGENTGVTDDVSVCLDFGDNAQDWSVVSHTVLLDL